MIHLLVCQVFIFILLTSAAYPASLKKNSRDQLINGVLLVKVCEVDDDKHFYFMFIFCWSCNDTLGLHCTELWVRSLQHFVCSSSYESWPLNGKLFLQSDPHTEESNLVVIGVVGDLDMIVVNHYGS